MIFRLHLVSYINTIRKFTINTLYCNVLFINTAKTKMEIVMSLESILIILIFGAIVGWLAGVIVKGYGFGLIGNIAVGIIGSLIGTWLFGYTGLSIGNGTINSIVGALIGAIILIFALRIVKSV